MKFYNKFISTFSVVTVSVLAVVVLFGLTPVASYAQSAPYLSGTLSLGSSGTQVNKLQTFLAADQHVYPSGLNTGYYGPLTKLAVMQYQLYYGIDPVGSVGPTTLASINVTATETHPLDVTAPAPYAVTVQAGQNSATISWVTNEYTLGKVYYSSSPLSMSEPTVNFINPYISGTVASDAGSQTLQSHNITIGGLQQGTTYYFMTLSTDDAGNATVSLPSTFATVN